MTTSSNIRHNLPENLLRRNTSAELRSPGLFARRPVLGLIIFLLGGLLFGALAFSVLPHGPLLRWDLASAKTWHTYAQNIPVYLVEYVLFGYFIGKEIILAIGLILTVYFLYKRFWRELSMVLIGLGGGALIWYFLSHYFDRPRPGNQLPVLTLHDPSFPSGLTMMAVLGYGLLAYLLIPRLPSRFWKWVVGIVLTLVIVMIGVSSLLLGGHYMSDVIAGYALGFAWAGLVYPITERVFPERGVSQPGSTAKATPYEGLRAPGLFGRRPVIGLVIVLLGGLVFAALGYNLLVKGPLVQVDQSVHQTFYAAAKAAPPIVNEIMLFGFFLGKQVVQVIVTILMVYFIYKRFWPELAMLIISSPVGSILWNFIIGYFNRPRPAEQTGLPITTIPSFPSGHAMSALICYGFLAYVLIPKMPSRFWKWTVGIVILAIVLFDGFSRVFQGNHYLTDVLAGYALGLAWAALVYTVIEFIFLRKKV